MSSHLSRHVKTTGNIAASICCTVIQWCNYRDRSGDENWSLTVAFHPAPNRLCFLYDLANPRCFSHWALDHTGSTALHPGGCCCQGIHRGSGMRNTCTAFVCFTLRKGLSPAPLPTLINCWAFFSEYCSLSQKKNSRATVLSQWYPRLLSVL